MKILLNILGILIYFINRYAHRGDKNKPFSVRFWLRNNWPELSTTLLLDIALMILLFAPGTEINFDQILSELPIKIKVPGSWLMAFLLGLGLTSLFYKLFKAKTESVKQNPES
jgi:hypothetical protein